MHVDTGILKYKDAESTLYTVSNSQGISVSFLSYGASVYSITMPDRLGRPDEVTLGWDNLDDYIVGNTYFGATIGRVANRISNSRYTFEDKQYKLPSNDGHHHLHGGRRGFTYHNWDSQLVSKQECAGVRFRRKSPHEEEGYPGNLTTTVSYLLYENGDLIIDFEAVTDRVTPVNLSNHVYWNLGGAGKGAILDHSLQIQAEYYLPCDSEIIPNGEIRKVSGTAMDFRSPKTIGRDIENLEQGYDHTYIISGPRNILKKAAILKHEKSGRKVTVYTTYPSLQLYSGNNLYPVAGARKRRFEQYGGVCLEAEFLPDSVNRPHFPDIFLRPGEVYRQRIVYSLEVEA